MASGGVPYLNYIVFGSYLFLSTLLLKHPWIMRRKKKLEFNAVHISHRGGSFENMENTLEAFEHSVDNCQTDMIHLEVQLTLDKRVVVAHENSLRRLCGSEKKISELNYKDLPPLLPSLDVEFLDGVSCMSLLNNSGSSRIPLLREVFERYQRLPIIIDIKQNNDELIEKVHDLIIMFRRSKFTIWGNISDVITQKCYRMDPSIPIIFSAPRVAWLLFASWTGLLPFMRIQESCLSIFHPKAQENNRNFREAAASNPACWFLLRFLDVLLMKRFIFEHLRRRGIQVHLWVANDPEMFDRCFELGATGVMTDCPSLLRAYLSEHPYVAFECEDID